MTAPVLPSMVPAAPALPPQSAAPRHSPRFASALDDALGGGRGRPERGPESTAPEDDAPVTPVADAEPAPEQEAPTGPQVLDPAAFAFALAVATPAALPTGESAADAADTPSTGPVASMPLAAPAAEDGPLPAPATAASPAPAQSGLPAAAPAGGPASADAASAPDAPTPVAVTAPPTPAPATAVPAGEVPAGPVPAGPVPAEPAAAGEPTAQPASSSAPAAPAAAPADAPAGLPVPSPAAGQEQAGTGPHADGDSPATPLTPAAAPAAPATPAPAPAVAATPAPAPPAPVAPQVAPVVAQLSSRPDGTHTMTMVLTPESLGTVEVRVTVRNGAIDLHLRHASEAGRAALLDAMPDLRRDLEASGLTLSRLDVSRDSGDPWTAAQQHQRQQEAREQAAARGEGNGRPWTRETDPETGRPARPGSPTPSGLDVRV
ncbi:flagellar hook-length control protein FliK [Trujillonella humicola]|uniref:flagellar hook-length control protein FliK n=1 Tax=Trujillonella humicola TaxID=3383699 RepID=UPI00390663BD